MAVKLNVPGLVLTRRLGESVVIGEDIVLTVTELGNGRVKLHFDAPRDVPIDRLEVWQDKNAGKERP